MSQQEPRNTPNVPVHAKLREMAHRVAARSLMPDNVIPAAHSPLPSAEAAQQIIDHCRRLLFPGYFGGQNVHPELLEEYIADLAEKTLALLADQIARCYRHNCQHLHTLCDMCRSRGERQAVEFLGKLPWLRELLEEDVKAAYEGDPAAKSHDEVIFSYPGVRAVVVYRCAHELHLQEVPLLPRLMAEIAHADTGIDIHPGACIGRGFFMDHGTGIVIGETSIIGNDVRLYQGVTLGAKSFPLDENGNPVKGIPRHPIVEDSVIIYAGATLLGRITIGRGSVIGGNVWLTQDVPPGTVVTQGRPLTQEFLDGEGI